GLNILYPFRAGERTFLLIHRTQHPLPISGLNLSRRTRRSRRSRRPDKEEGWHEIVLDSSRRRGTWCCARHLFASSPRSPRSPREIFSSAFMTDLRRSGELRYLVSLDTSVRRRGGPFARPPSSLRKRGSILGAG